MRGPVRGPRPTKVPVIVRRGIPALTKFPCANGSTGKLPDAVRAPGPGEFRNMLAATLFGNYRLWSPPQLSEHGQRIDNLIDVVHWFMLILFVGWGIFFIYALTKFR